jgi:hypothetical protein
MLALEEFELPSVDLAAQRAERQAAIDHVYANNEEERVARTFMLNNRFNALLQLSEDMDQQLDGK